MLLHQQVLLEHGAASSQLEKWTQLTCLQEPSSASSLLP